MFGDGQVTNDMKGLTDTNAETDRKYEKGNNNDAGARKATTMINGIRFPAVPAPEGHPNTLALNRPRNALRSPRSTIPRFGPRPSNRGTPGCRGRLDVR